VNAQARDPELYLPHEGTAVLLDEVWVVDTLSTRGTATVRADTPFAQAADSWPAWFAIELMAQVVAASAGLREPRAGGRPRLGLLLGVRAFECRYPRFDLGARLTIDALESTRDERGMGVFDCSIRIEEALVSQATLSVFLPESVEEYLRSIDQ